MALAGELIESLPTDDSFLHSEQQIQMANILFKENEGMMNVLAKELKDGLIISFLFIIFSTEQVDNLIRRMIPSAASNHIILVGIKCASIVLLFYIIKNFSLARK